MPYKNKKKQRKAVREASRRFRLRQRQALEQLKKNFPVAYQATFGKTKQKKTRKRK